MSSIVCSQHISTDSLCFSKEEAAVIMKDLNKVPLQDSIIQNQALQILNYKAVDKNHIKEVNLVKSQLEKEQKENTLLHKKIKVSGFIVKFGLPTALIGGFLIGKL